MSPTVLERLRAALTGSPDAPLVLLGNLEVERHWAVDEPGLPAVAAGGSRALVNRMDEFGLLLAGPDDHVVLKAPPDPAYLDYLEGLGIGLPGVLSVRDDDPARTVTEAALADPDLLAALGRLAAGKAHLWPHGVSEVEERLAERAGLPLAAPPAAVCKAVNSKIYSRLAADEAGLRQPPGLVCRDLDELAAACAQAREWLRAGQGVVLKDAYGVSGKGILRMDDERRLDRTWRMLSRRAETSGDARVALVLERWLPKRTDLNYQFTVDRYGGICFDFVREAVTAAGVHKGHRMPARLVEEQVDELRETAMALGARLAGDGYFGVVGVDALIVEDGTLYPMIEINARNNMSTYQERLRAAFFDEGRAAFATFYPMRLGRPVPFAELRDRLDDLLFDPRRGSGLLVNNTATVNAAAPRGEAAGSTFDGRLYAVVVAEYARGVAALDEEAKRRLAALAAATT